jgi:hypothetical protein
MSDAGSKRFLSTLSVLDVNTSGAIQHLVPATVPYTVVDTLSIIQVRRKSAIFKHVFGCTI